MTNLEPDDVIGNRVRDLRKRAGLSAEQLATRCAEAGYPRLSATAIYLIEGGGRGKAGTRSRRRVTVEELLVLAIALRATLLMLMLPENSAAHYQITPGIDGTTEHVFLWAIGARSTPTAEVPAGVEIARLPQWMTEAVGDWVLSHSRPRFEQYWRETADRAKTEYLAPLIRDELQRMGISVESEEKPEQGGGDDGEPADQAD